MQEIRRRVLRWHAAVLFGLAVTLTLATYFGFLLKLGAYAMLSGSALVLMALAQAYPLMAVVALCMWMGADTQWYGRFSLMAITAHCIPLLALIVSWGAIAMSPIAQFIPASFLIHGSGILVEILPRWARTSSI